MTSTEDEKLALQPSGKAIASLVCGICSLFGCMLWPLTVPIAIAGIVLGLMSLKSANGNLAIAGIATSIFSLLLSIVVTLGLFAFLTEIEDQEERIIPLIAEPPPEIFRDPPEPFEEKKDN